MTAKEIQFHVNVKGLEWDVQPTHIGVHSLLAMWCVLSFHVGDICPVAQHQVKMTLYNGLNITHQKDWEFIYICAGSSHHDVVLLKTTSWCDDVVLMAIILCLLTQMEKGK